MSAARATGAGTREGLRLARARPAEARAQADWIVAMQPWLGLGYAAAPLGRWLARAARGGPRDQRDNEVWVARARGASSGVDGILVLETPFLLGGFIALLAVRPAVRIRRQWQPRGPGLLSTAPVRARRAVAGSDPRGEDGDPAASWT